MSKVDHLSFNPLLLTILSHLEKRDILRCKMVSRRIRDVIEANQRDLYRYNRQLASLHMETLNKRLNQGKTDVALVVLRFWTNSKGCDMMITDSSVIIHKNTMPPITMYLKRRYKRVRFKWRRSEGDYQVWRYIVEHNNNFEFNRRGKIRARFDLFRFEEYRIKGLIDGLCTVLSLLASACEFEKFTINGREFNQCHSVPFDTAVFSHEQWTAISDELLKISLCRSLTTYSWFPGLVNFYTQWGCKCFHLKTDVHLSFLIPKLHLDGMFIEIYMKSVHFFDSLDPVHKMLKDWQLGEFTLRSISFSVPVGLKYPFTHADLFEAFEDLNCFSITEKDPGINDSEPPSVMFFIRRVLDNKTIGLIYNHHFLCISECLNREDEEPILNDYWDIDRTYDWCRETRTYIAKSEQTENNK